MGLAGVLDREGDIKLELRYAEMSQLAAMAA
jgi:hypothetical protein